MKSFTFGSLLFVVALAGCDDQPATSSSNGSGGHAAATSAPAVSTTPVVESPVVTPAPTTSASAAASASAVPTAVSVPTKK